MTSYYDLLDAIKNSLESHPRTNTVHEGDLYKVDLSKESIFPLANVDIGSSVFKKHVISFPVTIVFADILDETKENEKDEKNVFHGANNLQDIYNTQHAVANAFQSSLRRGDLADSDYIVVDEDITITAFEQRFENLLVGWVMNVSIEVPNNDISIC